MSNHVFFGAAALGLVLSAANAPAAGANGFGMLEEGWTELDPQQLTADEILGAEIRNLDGQQVATVGDVLLDGEGHIESLVAEFGGVLGFGERIVQLAMEQVDFIKIGFGDESEAEAETVVRTTVTPEALEALPDYEDES